MHFLESNYSGSMIIYIIRFRPLELPRIIILWNCITRRGSQWTSLGNARRLDKLLDRMLQKDMLKSMPNYEFINC